LTKKSHAKAKDPPHQRIPPLKHFRWERLLPRLVRVQTSIVITPMKRAKSKAAGMGGAQK